MIEYNGTDTKRINHAIKVFTYASHIGAMENCNEQQQQIIEYASILHDIGIHNAESKYKSTSGKYQEIEGPSVASELFVGLNIPEKLKERVLFLIGNHHTYNSIDGIDYQILVEADFIVNIHEDQLKIDAIASVKKKIFKTRTGLGLLKSMYET